MQVKVGNIVHRLHQQRLKLAPSLEFRKNYIEAAYVDQIRREKEMILSRIDRLQPGVRKVFLAARLQKLNALRN
jgi:hypothetical protein